MDTYYNPKSKEVKNWGEIKLSLAGVVLSTTPDPISAKEFGWFGITNPIPPDVSDELKIPKQGSLTKSGNTYSYTWTETNRFSKKSEETAYFKQQEDILAAQNRGIRDELLTKTDKYALSDYPSGMSTGMKNYRKSLRELPKHKNWPKLEEGDWPKSP